MELAVGNVARAGSHWSTETMDDTALMLCRDAVENHFVVDLLGHTQSTL